MKFVKIIGAKKAPYHFLGHYGILMEDEKPIVVEVMGRVGLKGSISITVDSEDYEVINLEEE